MTAFPEKNLIIKLLGISGSLRQASVNTAMLRAMKELALNNIEITLYSALQAIPPFNPDDELAEKIPHEVIKLRNEMSAADGILIASPEYAHGVSGVLKNAFDWVVGSAESIYRKPIALLNTSTRATIAYHHMRENIATMGGNIIDAVSKTIPLVNSHMTKDEIISDVAISNLLKSILIEFYNSILDKK
ncbi:MAG: hypothetical protein A3F13_05780 [Gammaproteobacteria bacterium RIFCSPHIGHO2_12_FULL_40_19]|nr:MAG: hypothetical protein A3F13_05780 [Gammaproteobacteria bacterium RIFCSPHIGHO2_12_FULL_40_19]